MLDWLSVKVEIAILVSFGMLSFLLGTGAGYLLCYFYGGALVNCNELLK